MSSSNSSAESTTITAQELLIDEARAVDVAYSEYFAAGILVLIVGFSIANWSHVLLDRYGRSRQSCLDRWIEYIPTFARRRFDGHTIRGMSIRPDRVVLPCLYVGINLTWMFTNVDISLGTMFAKRCGWLALCNLCLVVFLGLKNTPLAFLTNRSYEKLNLIHRCCGYATILFTMLHALNVIAGLAKEHLLMYLEDPAQYAGILGALGLLLIGISGIGSIRNLQYEIFFILHVSLVAMVLIATILHVQKINWSAIIIVGIAASTWFADRVLRLIRWIYYGYGNHCTLTPLPGGATRVVMHRPIKSRPGCHAFLWIPSIRKFQTHPFTLVSNSPANFIISARDGFTRELHGSALKHPQGELCAAIEGPYGCVPRTDRFGKIILLSGGSGITFTMALAMDWLQKTSQGNQQRTLQLVWSMKTKVV